ncbi:CaiF/GrlA family transcriptional regulator [Salmonella enterica]|uniref:CaiF/GrlA family transcriptional regulator n=2 Tax=Salmonella enterica TaxID=28901 RepID=A0A5Y6M4D2_SALHO|nr:CaiF/GrlA family transcriptional regulator [Salmonella enterica]EAA7382844.1 CaiF/GrlA family transcriptional regulator [Salmonella enterica subsp. enterica]EBF8286503.1 CaiF/GrlA family transcriptional regulator [Salmonella enterica subsp. houtenae]ECE0559509.1 CaiF/GrlA family transcriptional regulator [Salmonella enterica subsp. enterica serovar Richmond]ECU3289097.1 CaiF/GrlA family transcriptional regulator [Salmonella enterica subsp. houtenae serovar Houten]EHA4049904.1 CaiF/GrlA fami
MKNNINKRPGKIKENSQSNHEVTFIPESVAQYYKYPLYIIIALWCQQQNRWINRNDISEAFHMPVRRASFQLSYMTRRPKRIVFRVRQQHQVQFGSKSNEVWIDNVIIESTEQGMEGSFTEGRKKEGGGAYRSRVGNGMTGTENIWNTLVMMRQAKMKGEEDE